MSGCSVYVLDAEVFEELLSRAGTKLFALISDEVDRALKQQTQW